MTIVQAETQRAVEALRRVKRAANARVTLWTLGLTGIFRRARKISVGIDFCRKLFVN
jgi:hypothetical protein